jgi:hypothetical protein
VRRARDLLWQPRRRALAASPAPSVATTPADKRATGAYLRATYEFDRALLANDPSAEAAVAEYVKRLGGECPGVLANAPVVGIGGHKLSAAEVKQLEQQGALAAEVLVALIGRWFSPDLGPLQTLAHTIGPLHWHAPRIARLVRAELSELERLVSTPPPDVCADMRAWAASGYQTLPPGTFASQKLFADEPAGGSLEASIRSLEDPAQKALARRRKRVSHRLAKRLEHVLSDSAALMDALGFKTPSILEEPTEGDVIGRGTTAARTSYTISALAPAKGCPVILTITEAGNGNESTFNGCFPHSTSSARLGTGCNEGHRTIWTTLPASVQSVALKLAGGRTIVSPALAIPAGDGGPLGFYYQALPRSAAKPVSLVELDARGRRERSIAIPKGPSCPIPKPGESTSSGTLGVANGR